MAAPPHTLVFHEAGHFHAALLLRSPNPRVDRTVHVYARPGDDLDRFCALITGFNQRPDDPTDWDLHVHAGDDPLERLVADRAGSVAIVAGRNEPKLGVIRRLHDAGFAVLADKPWLTTEGAVADLEAVTSGPPLIMDLMTERHDVTARLRRQIVTTDEVFGRFVASESEPALEAESVHHLCKTVDGRPLRRPPWYYDVQIQGDGLVDIQSHLVDQAQWLIGAASAQRRAGADPAQRRAGADPAQRLAGAASAPVLTRAERWSTPVPLALFTESTGASRFPPALADRVSGLDGVEGGTLALALACNGLLEYRLDGCLVRQRTEWRARQPEGGGDTHWSVARGTGASVTIRLGPETGFRAEIHVGAGAEPSTDLGSRLDRHLAGWEAAFPGLSVAPSELGYRLVVPAALATPHETTFPLVLDAFLDRVESGSWEPSEAAVIGRRYTLLAQATTLAVDTDLP